MNECEWTGEPEAYGSYTTACGHDFAFNDDGVAENQFKYCPYCGKRINAVEDESRDS